MKITMHKSIINMDMVTKISRELWPWEVDILDAKHGDGTVQVIDPTVEVERESLPDAADEFARLARMYGSDNSGMSYVEVVYGRGKAGIRALEKAMKQQPKRKVAKKKTAAKKPATAKKAAVGGDPLA